MVAARERHRTDFRAGLALAEVVERTRRSRRSMLAFTFAFVLAASRLVVAAVHVVVVHAQ